MSVAIRPLSAADEAAWLDLFGAYIAFYRASVPNAVIAMTWQRMLSPDEPELVALVAVDAADTPIGLAHLVLHRSTWSPTRYCYLEDLYVAAAARGQGVGRALIAAVYAEADRRGCTRTYWMTEADNGPARALYDRVANDTTYVQYRR